MRSTLIHTTGFHKRSMSAFGLLRGNSLITPKLNTDLVVSTMEPYAATARQQQMELLRVRPKPKFKKARTFVTEQTRNWHRRIRRVISFLEGSFPLKLYLLEPINSSHLHIPAPHIATATKSACIFRVYHSIYRPFGTNGFPL